MAAKLALDKLGQETIAKAQGEYWLAVERGVYGMQKAKDEDDAKQQRGKVYLYHLLRFLKTHPLPTEVQPQFVNVIAEAA